ncbi:MAG: ATP-binding cassette domain-containing protein, partial [Pseudomonadales bacterium]
MTNCVEFRGVDKSFVFGPGGHKKVLDGIELRVPEGITTAVVGESGSGKTTLLQLINAVLEPDAGEVRVFDESIPDQHREKFRRRIGYSVQGAGLFPHMTNRDNVVLLAKLEGWIDDLIEERYQV